MEQQLAEIKGVFRDEVQVMVAWDTAGRPSKSLWNV